RVDAVRLHAAGMFAKWPRRVVESLFVTLCSCGAAAEGAKPFNALAFYTGKHDLAHISFVKEANAWFAAAAKNNGFSYEATTDWTRLSAVGLAGVQVVLFLDTRPEDPAQREAFRAYMEQ